MVLITYNYSYWGLYTNLKLGGHKWFCTITVSKCLFKNVLMVHITQLTHSCTHAMFTGDIVCKCLQRILSHIANLTLQKIEFLAG